MLTIFPEPCISVLPTWTICPSRSFLTSPFLAVNHLSWMNGWLIASSFFLLFVQPLLFLFSSAGISNTEARQPGKAPNFSVNWTVGDQGLEIINATTGKDDLGRQSHLCKHALYSRWVCLYAKVKHFFKGGWYRIPQNNQGLIFN